MSGVIATKIDQSVTSACPPCGTARYRSRPHARADVLLRSPRQKKSASELTIVHRYMQRVHLLAMLFDVFKEERQRQCNGPLRWR